MFCHEEWRGRSDWLKHADEKIESAEIAYKRGLESRPKYSLELTTSWSLKLESILALLKNIHV